MHLSRSLFIAIAVSCTIGCNQQPPVAAPEAPDRGVETASMPADTLPSNPPVVKPSNTATEPATPGKSPENNNSLRELASRLVEPAEGGSWRISESAALELERLGPEATAQLLPLLSDEQLEVRRGAAFHLLSSFDPKSAEQVAAFKKLLADRDATVRNIGFQAVKELPPAEIAAASAELTALLNPQHETKPENRAAVARLVGALGQHGASFAPGLEKAATSDSDERVRAAAVFAYCQIASPPETAIPLLQKTLQDKQPAVRLVSTGRLRALAAKAAPAADDLGIALSDQDDRVRLAASEALARIGTPALAALKTALESKDPNAKKLALACLSSLGPAAQEALPTIEKAQSDPDKDISAAAKVLAERLKQ